MNHFKLMMGLLASALVIYVLATPSEDDAELPPTNAEAITQAAPLTDPTSSEQASVKDEQTVDSDTATTPSPVHTAPVQAQQQPLAKRPEVSEEPEAPDDGEETFSEAEAQDNPPQTTQWHGLPEEYIQVMDQDMKQAASTGNWHTLIELAKDLNAKQPKYRYEFSIFLAIKHDAPIEVFETLVAQGGRFSYRHLFLVVQEDNFKLYNRLTSLGMSVHLTNPQGHNALFVGVIPKTKFNMLFYKLLRDRVNPNIKVNDKDVAQISLEYILSKPVRLKDMLANRKRTQVAINFRDLVKFGATLEEKHLKMLAEIRETLPMLFELMTKQAPEIIQMVDDYQANH